MMTGGQLKWDFHNRLWVSKNRIVSRHPTRKLLPPCRPTVPTAQGHASRRPAVLQTALPLAYGNPDPGPFPLQHHPPGIGRKGESLDEAIAPLARNDGPAQLLGPNLLGVLRFDSPLRGRSVEDDLPGLRSRYRVQRRSAG